MNSAVTLAVWDFIYAVLGAICTTLAFDWKIGLAYFFAVKALTPYAIRSC